LEAVCATTLSYKQILIMVILKQYLRCSDIVQLRSGAPHCLRPYIRKVLFQQSCPACGVGKWTYATKRQFFCNLYNVMPYGDRLCGSLCSFAQCPRWDIYGFVRSSRPYSGKNRWTFSLHGCAKTKKIYLSMDENNRKHLARHLSHAQSRRLLWTLR
jgi:hypothetical protein